MARRLLTGTVSIASLVFSSLAGCGDDWEPPSGKRPIAGAGGSSAGGSGKPDGGAAGAAGDEGASVGGSPVEAGAGAAGELAGAGGVGAAGGGGADGGTAGDGVGGASGDAGTGGSLVGGAAGVGGEGGAVDPLPRADVEDLAIESNADYANNAYGLITGAKLKSYIDNWEANRPAGVTGKLVILQIQQQPATERHVAGNGANVVSYLVAQYGPAAETNELLQKRENGLSSIEQEIPDGARTDALLQRYAIDPLKDYVALTFEELGYDAEPQNITTLNAVVHWVGRAWLTLRYWGYPAERIGILNGSVNWNAQNQGLVITSDPPATPPGNGTGSVKDLRVDNTGYVITLSQLLAILKQEDGATPLEDVSIVDARGGAEALGLKRASNTNQTDCASYTANPPINGITRCSPPFEGRIKGANNVPWTDYITSAADGFRYKSKADVKSLFDTKAEYQPGQITIQYCRTNMRSTVTGIVANVILGYPARFYDTSFIEWSHLAYGPTPLTQVLPENSAYRTDTAALTEHAEVTGGYTPGGAVPAAGDVTWVDGPNYNEDQHISVTRNDPIVPTATSTNLTVEADRAYKLD